MNARRVIVWAVSLAFGLISTIGIILVFGTTLEKFTPVNAILVFLSIVGNRSAIIVTARNYPCSAKVISYDA